MGITAKDIAKKAGVSEATVSCVLNNKGNRISEKTREKVLKIAEKYEFSCNPIAVSLATQKTNTIGLILPNLTNPFLTQLSTGIEKQVRENNYALFLTNCEESATQCVHYLNVFQQRKMEGIIIVLPKEEELLSAYEVVQQALHKCTIPVVLIEHAMADAPFDFITVNNKQGGFMATEYLIQKGHHKIGHIAGLQFTLQRKDGYIEALKKNSIEIRDDYILQGDFTIESGYHCAKQLFQTDITAIFAGNDLMALGVARAARDAGMEIPRDLSLIGFDDDPIASVMDVPLTTMRQPGIEIGTAACELLLERIQTGKKEHKVHFYLPELIVRDSVADFGLQLSRSIK